jgi:hypothetical protein
MAKDKHRDNIGEAVEMVNLTKECWRKIDFLTNIRSAYGDLKISEIIEILEYQANKFNKRFQDLIKTD